MKANNHILNNLKLNDLNSILNKDLEFKIKGGGRYVPIGDKWVTPDALATRITTLAKNLNPKDQKTLNHLVKIFIYIDKNNYTRLEHKIKKAKGLNATLLQGDRFFKTLLSRPKEQRHDMLQGLIKTSVKPAKESSAINLIHQKVEKEHHLSELQLKRYYAKVLENSSFTAKSLDGYSPSGAIYSYLHNLKQYRKMVSSPHKSLDRTIDELEFAYRITLMNRLKSNKEPFLNDILKKILELPASDKQGKACVLIPGGCKGHAMMYKIEKEKNGTFSFTIINTGKGSKYHALSSALTRRINKRRTIQDVVYSNLTPQHLSINFISKLLAKNTYPNMRVVNQMVEKSLMRGGAKKHYGRKHLEQRQGSCTFKNISATLREKLGSKDYNSFKLFMTKQEIRNLKNLNVNPKDRQLKARMLDEGKKILLHRKRRQLIGF
jgi:hypothetical protein